MHNSLDSALGRQRRLNQVGESITQIAPDPAAAYSLRSLTGGDPKVVRVRRGSDNHEQDFTASEVSSGALVDFVNAQVTAPLDIREIADSNSDGNNDGRVGDFLIAKAAYSLRSLGTRQALIANNKPTSFIVAGAGTSAVNGTYVQNGLSPNGSLPKPIAYTLFDTDGTTALFSIIGELGGDAYLIAGSPNSGNAHLYEGSLDGAQADEYKELSGVDGGAEPAPSLTSGQFDQYVAEVRRSSDYSTKQFTATEVTDGTLLSFVNEDVITEQSDFTSGVDGYAKDSHGTVTREASFEGKSDVLNYTHFGGRFAFKNTGVSLERTSSYTITFEYYADSLHSGKVWGVENAFANRTTASSNTPTVVSGAWTSATLNVPSGRTTGATELVLRIQANAGSVYGETGDSTVRLKNIVVTQLTGSGFVKTWYDQSVTNQAGDTATGNHATQGTAADQPKIVDAGALLDLDSDGIPAVNFDGGKYMVFSSISAKTVVGVNHLTSTTSLNYLVGKNLGDGGVRTASGNGIFQGADCPTSQSADFNNAGGSTHMNGSQSSFLATTKNVYFGTATSGNALTSIGTGFSFSGSSRSWRGRIAEVILYDTDQTDNRTAIEANIGEAYSIDLPAGVDPLNDEVDGFVETWYDQSGNVPANDLTQTTASKQPTIVTGGTLNTRNSQPIIKFIQANSTFLQTVDSTMFPSGSSLAVTIFHAMHVDASSGNRIGVFGSNGAGNNSAANTYRFGSFPPRKVGLKFSNASTTQVTLQSGLYANNTDSILTYQFALNSGTASLQAFNNGSSLSSISASTTDQSYSAQPGVALLGARTTSDNFSDSEFFEVIAYGSDQLSNRSAIETNMNSHYSIF